MVARRARDIFLARQDGVPEQQAPERHALRCRRVVGRGRECQRKRGETGLGRGTQSVHCGEDRREEAHQDDGARPCDRAAVLVHAFIYDGDPSAFRRHTFSTANINERNYQHSSRSQRRGQVSHSAKTSPEWRKSEKTLTPTAVANYDASTV